MKKAHDFVKDRYKMYWWGAGGSYVARKALLKGYKKYRDRLEHYIFELEADLKKDDEDIAFFLEKAKSEK